MSRRKFLAHSGLAVGVLFTAPALLFQNQVRSLNKRNGFKVLLRQGYFRKITNSDRETLTSILATLRSKGYTVETDNGMTYGNGNFMLPAVKTNIFSNEGWLFLTKNRFTQGYKTAFLEERYIDDLDTFTDGYISGMNHNGYSSNHARFLLPDRIIAESNESIGYINGFGNKITLQKCKGRLKVLIA